MDRIKAARRLVEAAILEAEDQGQAAEVRELCAVLQRLWWAEMTRDGCRAS